MDGCLRAGRRLSVNDKSCRIWRKVCLFSADQFCIVEWCGINFSSIPLAFGLKAFSLATWQMVPKIFRWKPLIILPASSGCRDDSGAVLRAHNRSAPIGLPSKRTRGTMKIQWIFWFSGLQIYSALSREEIRRLLHRPRQVSGLLMAFLWFCKRMHFMISCLLIIGIFRMFLRPGLCGPPAN